MGSFLWPSDDGWPYPDTGPELIDHDSTPDDDLLALSFPTSHVFDGLDALERRVLSARFGLGGEPERSLGQLHDDMGLPQSDLGVVLDRGLAKLRHNLSH